MNSLVTGGAGFIGSHLVEELLTNGHHVRLFDNFSTGRLENIEHIQSAQLEIVKCDITDDVKVQQSMRDIDYVFHLAALADIVPSIGQPLKYHHSNVNGTVSMLIASQEAKVKKFIYAASSSCYGLITELPTSESAAISPEYPYALTKYIGEEYALHWHKVYGLPVNSLRLFNVYGPRSRTSGTYGAVFGVFLAQKLAGEPYTVVGDGMQRRDFTFVKDIARAFRLAAESDVAGEIFNVGSGHPQSINKLVELLGGEKIFIPKRPGEPESTHANITKIKSLLGWEPEVSFGEGVRIMLENIDYWRRAIVWTPETIAESTKEWFEYLS